MKKPVMQFLVRLVVLFAAVLIAPAARADADDFMILWWQVGDPGDESDNGVSLKDVVVYGVNGAPPTTAYDLGVNAARIRATSGDTETYLSMLNPTAYAEFLIDPDDTIVRLDYNMDYMNVPTIWQADITDFANGSPEYAFVIELGNYENGDWSTLAVSETVSYSDLVTSEAIAQSNGAYNPNYATPWVATSYVVPEPTSGMLILVGAALLALRRRRGALGRG